MQCIHAHVTCTDISSLACFPYDMFLLAHFTPAYDFTILLMDVGKTASTATDIAMRASRVPIYQSIGKHILCDHRASANERKLANCYATNNHRASTKGSTIPDKGGCSLPILSAFKCSIRSDSSGEHIIGKTHVRTDEDTILYSNPFKKRDMILNFDA